MRGKLIIPTQRVFYGWFVVAAAFAVCFVGFGSAYTFSAFVAPLQNDFAASRGSVSLVFSLAGFLYFGLGIISGPLADRWGSRRLAIAGMILTGAGLAAAGFARSLIEVYTAYGLGVGLGVGLAYVPALGAVQRWGVGVSPRASRSAGSVSERWSCHRSPGCSSRLSGGATPISFSAPLRRSSAREWRF